MEEFGSQSFCIEILKEYQCNSKFELESETAKICIQRRADKLCLPDKTDLNKNWHIKIYNDTEKTNTQMERYIR